MTGALMQAIQSTLRGIATVSGLVAILAPLASVLFKSGRARGRSIGTGAGFRRWPAVSLVTMGLLSTGILLWKPLPVHPPAATQYLLTWIGFLIYVPAICLYLWGFIVLGRYFGVSSSGGADLYSGHKLVKDGPFRFVRHPMYLAIMLAAMGAFLFFCTWAMMIFLPMSTVVIRRAYQEEALLGSEFEDEWRSYAIQVPGWIPRLFRKNSTN